MKLRLLRLSPRLFHRRMKNLLHCRTSAAATEKCFTTRTRTRIKPDPVFYNVLHNQISLFPQRFIYDELVFAEAPRKQSQLTTHLRKLKLWSRKQRGSARKTSRIRRELYRGFCRGSCSAFNISTWKRASCQNGVHFFHISTSKSGLTLACSVHFDFEICFAPQWRASIQHRNF